jgi:hypothetical protein
MAYCHKCVSGGECQACQQLQPLDLTEPWLAFLRSRAASFDGDAARTLAAIAASSGQLLLFGAANQTYQVIVARSVPKGLKFWKTAQQVRLVVDREGHTVRAGVEEVGK